MILITGSAGYIGSEICKLLEEKKIKYIGVDSLKYTYVSNIFNKKNFIKCCISNKKKINKILKKYKITTILHSAAYAYVNDAKNNKKKYERNNIINTRVFIETVINNNIKNFIFLSSSNVYSDSKKSFEENDKKKPKNFYGKTKLIIEKFLLDNKEDFNNLIVLRLFNIIGLTKKFKPKNFGNFKFQRFLFKAFYRIKKKLPLEVNFIKKKNNKLTFPCRDFVDIKDLSRLILSIINRFKKNNSCNIYNVGSGKSFSINKILELLKINNKKIIIKYNKLSSDEYISTKSIIKKIQVDYKWKPKISINSSINSYIDNIII